MENSKVSPINPASVGLGAMGFNAPWSIDMAMKRWEQGHDVFYNYPPKESLDSVQIYARIQRACSQLENKPTCLYNSVPVKISFWKKVFKFRGNENK